jgi:hypothetical protein
MTMMLHFAMTGIMLYMEMKFPSNDDDKKPRDT